MTSDVPRRAAPPKRSGPGRAFTIVAMILDTVAIVAGLVLALAFGYLSFLALVVVAAIILPGVLLRLRRSGHAPRG